MMSRFGRLLTGLVVVLALVSSFYAVNLSVSAQDGGDSALATALKSATQFLSQQLGVPITSIQNYTYSIDNFPDDGLGCPQPGQSFPAAPQLGYNFTIIFNGNSYEVHTSSDASRSVMCSGGSVKAGDGLLLYRSPKFTVPYPNTWNAVDRTTDIFFGVNGKPVCSQPGMIATALGNTTESPDALLDDYVKANTGTKLSDRTSVGSIGRSATFTAPCTDGSIRMNRVTTYVAYGRGFRLQEYAPQTGYDQWSDTFETIVQQFAPATNSTASAGQAIVIPNVSPLASIAHIFAGNVYIGTLSDLPGTAITTDAADEHVYRHAVISPDGKHLAFVDPANSAVFVASMPLAGGSAPAKRADGLVPGFPVAWSPDGSEIAYLVSSGSGSGDSVPYSVMAVSIDGGTRQIGMTDPVRTSCGDTSTDPAELLYRDETGPDGNTLLLAWTHRGVFYSLGCDGIGVALLSTDGTNKIIDPLLRRATLSPDGSELLGLTGASNEMPRLVRVRLDDQFVLPVVSGADQAAYSADTKFVFYTLVTAGDQIKLDSADDQDRGTKLFGVWPFQTTRYDVELHQVDLSNQNDSVLFKGTGRGIGRLAPSPDGAGLLYSFVGDDSNLVEAFRNNASSGDLMRAAPAVSMYWLPLPSGQPQLMAVTNEIAWGPLGSGLAPTPTGNPKDIVSGPTWTPTAAPTDLPSPTLTPTPTFFVTPTAPALLPPPTNTPHS